MMFLGSAFSTAQKTNCPSFVMSSALTLMLQLSFPSGLLRREIISLGLSMCYHIETDTILANMLLLHPEAPVTIRNLRNFSYLFKDEIPYVFTEISSESLHKTVLAYPHMFKWGNEFDITLADSSEEYFTPNFIRSRFNNELPEALLSKTDNAISSVYAREVLLNHISLVYGKTNARQRKIV